MDLLKNPEIKKALERIKENEKFHNTEAWLNKMVKEAWEKRTNEIDRQYDGLKRSYNTLSSAGLTKKDEILKKVYEDILRLYGIEDK